MHRTCQVLGHCWHSTHWELAHLGSAGKEFTCNAGDQGSIPGLGRSPGEGKGYPLQYSGLEEYIVHGVAKSRTRLSDFQFPLIHYKIIWCIYEVKYYLLWIISMLFTIISEDEESLFSIKKVYTVITVTIWYWSLKVLNECLLINTKWI